MPRPVVSLSFSLRVAIFAGALCLSAGASPREPAPEAPAVPNVPQVPREPALRLAVSALRVDEALAESACAQSEDANLRPAQRVRFPLALAQALADSLAASGIEAVADTTLTRWLGRLDVRFPDPRDYGRARDYIASTGAKRLVYVNDLRLTPHCELRFEAALWNTEPLGRRATRSDSSRSAAEAAHRLSQWLTPWLSKATAP